MKEIDMDLMPKREPSHREVRQTFQQNSDPILIKIYDEEVRNVRKKVSDKENRNNVRHYGDQVIIK